MRRRYVACGTVLLALAGTAAHAGTITGTAARYDFTGSISGTGPFTYSESGGTPATATVTRDANNMGPTLSNGQIFFTNDTAAPDEALTATIPASNGGTSYILEALITPTGDQGLNNVAPLANILSLESVSGSSLIFRFDTDGSGTGTLRGYARNSGGGYQAVSSVADAVPTGVQTHVALVYTADGDTAQSNDRLDLYIDGTLVATTGSLVFNAQTGAFTQNLGILNDNGSNEKNRALNGSSDAIAVRTFTGTFDPATDFALVPEPAGLGLLAAAGLLAVRRSRGAQC